MLKTRIALIIVFSLLVVLLFQLPKSVIQNNEELGADSTIEENRLSPKKTHQTIPTEFRKKITKFQYLHRTVAEKEKKAIFADSLASLYIKSGIFDSAAIFAEEAAAFFVTVESWKKTGDTYYQAYTFAIDPKKQNALALKAQEFYRKVLSKNANDLDVKNNMAMTYLSSTNPMQGVLMLREVLTIDPTNEMALFNLGMLSVQSGQYENAIDRLEKLIGINPKHIQAQLLLGVAYKETGNTFKARRQFEKVKDIDKDPAVQATADSYLKDLK